MTREKDKLRRIVKHAALEANTTVSKWLDLHGIGRTTYYRNDMPDLLTVYKVCDSAGVKVSDFFKEVRE